VNGVPIYQWGRYVAGATFSESSYVPTCVEDSYPVLGGELHTQHAYFVKNLAVDEATGDFSFAPNVLFSACTSGMTGKAMTWGYYPWQHGMAAHELATRVGRADYCGSGESWTFPGNGLQIRDVHGVSDWHDEDFPIEAAWDATGAICLGTPRHVPLRDNPSNIECDGQSLPTCDETHLV